MNRFRFYKSIDNQKVYLDKGRQFTYFSPDLAGLFTQQDYENWGEAEGWSKELPEDQRMKNIDAPMLPGME